jgi:hypothetical protein
VEAGAEAVERRLVVGAVAGAVLRRVAGEPERLLDDGMVDGGAALDEAMDGVAGVGALGPGLLAGAGEREPVRLNPLAGDAAARDEPLREAGLGLERAPALGRVLRERVEHRLAPRECDWSVPASWCRSRTVGVSASGSVASAW